MKTIAKPAFVAVLIVTGTDKNLQGDVKRPFYTLAKKDVTLEAPVVQIKIHGNIISITMSSSKPVVVFYGNKSHPHTKKYNKTLFNFGASGPW